MSFDGQPGGDEDERKTDIISRAALLLLLSGEYSEKDLKTLKSHIEQAVEAHPSRLLKIEQALRNGSISREQLDSLYDNPESDEILDRKATQSFKALADACDVRTALASTPDPFVLSGQKLIVQDPRIKLSNRYLLGVFTGGPGI